jgi:branched-chain amino acid transport system ATP-binding protein
MSLLEARNLSIAFGGVHAVEDVTLEVAPGELVGLIGPNGAGKTTFLKLLTGVHRTATGTILFDRRDVSREPVHRRARLGLAMTHQIVRPFRHMTLLENVALAAAQDIAARPFLALLRTDRQASRERALPLLEQVGIAEVANRLASEVPLGHLKRMQIARALAARPKLLLLDEPLAGLNPAEATRTGDLIRALNEGGLTIILIEHNLGEVLRIVRRLAVLDRGELIADGLPESVIRQREVRAAYLGESDVGQAA